jgi:hypothetical protein
MNLSERFTLGFYNWEIRGRGYHYFSNPVQLEPPFYPFSHANHLPVLREVNDDGKVPSIFVQALHGFKEFVIPSRQPELYADNTGLTYDTTAFPAEKSHSYVEFQLTLPPGKHIALIQQHELIIMLSSTRFPVSFELIGNNDSIVVQIACDDSESNQIHEYIKLFLPEINISKQTQYIDTIFDTSKQVHMVYLALEEEFMRPLPTELKPTFDPIAGVFATLEQVKNGEIAMVQILFQGTQNAWQQSILNSVTDFNQKPFFADDPSILPQAKEKVSSPLFAVSIRLYAASSTDQRNQELLQGLYAGISNTQTGSNSLIPLNTQLPSKNQFKDIVMRTSHMLGMLLNSKELVNLVHVPFASVHTPKLRKYVGRTHLLPAAHIQEQYVLGINDHYGISQPVGLTIEERLRHVHVIGATGSGKSYLLTQLIRQDLEQDHGVCVIDPNADLIDACINYIPKHRLKDVILIDPSSEFSPGINLLSAQSYQEQMVLESDLVSIFKRQSTSWGDQMSSVLSNAINAFLESRKGGTLLDLRKFLADKSFRNEFLKTVSDEVILSYWNHEFPLLKSNSIAPILTRLDTFLRPKPIRAMMSQRKGIDFSEVMNGKKILLVKLPQGLIGSQNSYLLGTLIIAKINQAAQARQNLAHHERIPFFLYIDEFQQYVTDSISTLLYQSRKYGLGLVLAHQGLEQIFAREKEVAEAVLANAYTRICFRVGSNDAKKLESGFAHFSEHDLQNLSIGNAIVRIGQPDHDGNITIPPLPKSEYPFHQHLQIIQKNNQDHYQVVTEKEPIVPKIEEEEISPIEKITETVEEKPLQTDIPKQTISLPLSPPKGPIANSAGTNSLIDDLFAEEKKRKELRQHSSLQIFIKKSAEGLGYKAVLETPTKDRGRIDIVASYQETKIAIEISVTNTIAYEIQNILKCFRDGYSMVFMVSESAKHLNSIREKSIVDIPEQYHNKLHFLSKNEVVEQLSKIAQSQQTPNTTVIRGYRVKVTSQQTISPAEQKMLLNDVVKAVKKTNHES